jgi:hypothetical protein
MTTTRKEQPLVPYPTRILDADQLSAEFEDHTENIYLGPWKELLIGNLRLIRQEDGQIQIEKLEPHCALS